MKIHEAVRMQSAFPTGRDVRKEDTELWAQARTARKRARKALRTAGGVA